MATEQRLIDANELKEMFDSFGRMFVHEVTDDTAFLEEKKVYDALQKAPTVNAYTVEQIASIVRQVDEAERELRKQVAWLKSCINCKIRKECPRHGTKVVHDCDHWEYGDPTGKVVRCINCQKHEPCEVRNRVWCRQMGRYMKEDGFCSEGVNGDD